jgi:hypothetical protein
MRAGFIPMTPEEHEDLAEQHWAEARRKRDLRDGPPPPEADPTTLETCEDPRLRAAGYIVCGSDGDKQWHWKSPATAWHDGYRSERSAALAALRHLGEQK